jgi:hypothetical protein
VRTILLITIVSAVSSVVSGEIVPFGASFGTGISGQTKTCAGEADFGPESVNLGVVRDSLSAPPCVLGKWRRNRDSLLGSICGHAGINLP